MKLVLLALLLIAAIFSGNGYATAVEGAPIETVNIVVTATLIEVAGVNG
jgi:uncharacterized protein HemY